MASKIKDGLWDVVLQRGVYERFTGSVDAAKARKYGDL
jgi:hypothetical protein